MKTQLEEMNKSYAELNSKHEEALALVSKFQEEEETRAAAEAAAFILSKRSSANCDADFTNAPSRALRELKAADWICIKSSNCFAVTPADEASPPVDGTVGNAIYFFPLGSGAPDLPTYSPKNAAPAPTIVDMNAACALVGSGRAINHVVDE